MNKSIELKTERLLLRQWKPDDYPLFAKMNADIEVMKYFPNVLTNEESDVLANKIKNAINENAWGFWAIELLTGKDSGKFIGFAGLNQPSYALPVKSCTEIGWRLARKYWGNGYATEAGKASLEFAFQTRQLNEVYSFTAVSNKPSYSVMERLGLQNSHTNFNHPMVPEGHRLQAHVLYKITQSQWKNS